MDHDNCAYLCVGRGNGKSIREVIELLDWISEHPDGKIIMPRKCGYTYSMKEAARILSDIPHVKKSHEDFIDALYYGITYDILNKWKGEEKMGTMECFGGAAVNGNLYYRDDDGNFVKLMTVTNIEETTDIFGDSNSRAEIKVDGYAPWKSEKVEVNDSRRILGSISEKWGPEYNVYFMIFDGTDLSVEIERNFIGRIPDYSYPYRVTVYDKGCIIQSQRYQTWHDLECSFLYAIGEVLNASFSHLNPGKISKMLRNAEKIVAYNVREENETEKSRRAMKTLINQVYGRATSDDFGRSLPVATYIDKVIFDNPATVILWKDGTRTVVHAQDGEPYDKEKGFAMAICKKIFGNGRDYYHVFKRWFRKGEDRSKENKK